MSDQEERKASALKLSAEALKQLAILDNSNQTSRRGKEAHPRAVLSTKKLPPDDVVACSRRCSSPGVTIPVTATSCKRTLSSRMVSSPHCTAVRRQKSTSVDPAPPSSSSSIPVEQTETEDGYVIIEAVRKISRTRPKNLELRRNFSNTSSGSSSTPGKASPCSPSITCSPSCPPLPADDHHDLVHSYPPGPTSSLLWQQWCLERKEDSQHLSCLPQTLPSGPYGEKNSELILARKIAERLKVIGDHVSSDKNNLEITELIESIVNSVSSGQGSILSWRSVVQLYQTLSRLLGQCLENGDAHGDNEPWLTFSKLWKMVLQSVVGWIMDNGGWNAFIRETEFTATSYFTSYTPDSSRRRFTYSHPPNDGGSYFTPQLPRRGFLHINSSSPTISCGCGLERQGRVLSLTEDGLLHQEGTYYETHPAEEEEEEEEEEERRSNDEGLHRCTPSSPSISSPDTCDSPVVRDPPSNINNRPQSSTLTPETGSNFYFDRNRSHSFPFRRRPNSAGKENRLTFDTSTEEEEVICEGESMDSGLEASSELSIASSADSMQYSALGVSAVCILEALKSLILEQK